MNAKVHHLRLAGIFLLFFGAISPVFADLQSGQYWLDLISGWEYGESPGASGTQGNLEILDDVKRFALNYDFEKGGEYVSASRSLEDIEPAESITGVDMLVWGPGGPVYLAVVDSTDQVFTFLLGSLDDDSQHAFHSNLDNPESVSGGKGDKKMHFPLKTIQFIVKKAPPMLKGKVTFERIALSSPQYQVP